MTATATPKRKVRRTPYVSLNVGHIDVDLDDFADDLVDAGWHHEDDCNGTLSEDGTDTVTDTHRALLDYHDAEHGITDWVTCRKGPCDVIPREFKEAH